MAIFQLHFKKADVAKITALEQAATSKHYTCQLAKVEASDMVSIQITTTSFKDIFLLGVQYQRQLQKHQPTNEQ